MAIVCSRAVRSVDAMHLLFRAACLALAVVAGPLAPATEPPTGFTSLFNGRDLAGWRGRPHFDPHKEAEGTPEERAKRQADWNADAAQHWQVENGVIVSDGQEG